MRKRIHFAASLHETLELKVKIENFSVFWKRCTSNIFNFVLLNDNSILTLAIKKYFLTCIKHAELNVTINIHSASKGTILLKGTTLFNL